MSFFKRFWCGVAVTTSLATITHAQTAGTVKGKLADSKDQPVAFATITLLRADSTVAGGDLSKDDGGFAVAPVSPGTYSLRIESIGYATKWMSVTNTADKPETQLGKIKLAQTETNLKGVEITAEKAVMEMKVDKKVFNVEKNTTTAGGSATDVLQNVPAISVDADGNISLRGKSNVTVLIDGKPATLLGSDVTSALQSLPAASISNVEVITNPSAKYDAQGTTGIINIITKKDGRLGMNGTVTVGAGTNDKYNGNLGLNLRKGKWSTFLNSSFRINNTYNNVTTTTQDINTPQSYYTYEHVPRLFNGLFNTIGGTYDFDNNNSLTFTGNVNKMQFGFDDYSDYYIYSGREQTGKVLQHTNRYSTFSGGPLSLSASLDYKHKFKKKDEELTADATFSSFNIRRHQTMNTTLDSGAGSTQHTIYENAPGGGTNNSINVWADYTNPMFTKNGKLGAGFKSQIFDFTSSADNPTIRRDGGAVLTNDALNQSYNYTQQIHAAYVNWNDQYGKFGYQVGLRAEDALYDGTGKVPAAATFHNSFLNLFPSAFVSYQLPAQQSVYVNYSRRVNRPNIFQMMPYKDLSNPGTISMGNPDILPEFIHNVEFSYSKNDKKGNTFIASAYYSQTQNLIERIPRKITLADSTLGLTNDVGQLLNRPVNIASGTTFGLEGSAKLQLTKFWDATLSGNFFQNDLKVGQQNAAYSSLLNNNSGHAWFAKANTNLKLPKGFSLQVNGNYESPKVITQGTIAESYWVDVAVRKMMFKNKATLVINCSDVFKTRQFITNYNTVAYTQTIDRVKETRIGNITFTYRFGKSEFGKNVAGMKGPGAPGKPEKSMERKPVKPSGEDRESNLKQSDDDNQGGGGQGGGGQRK